MMFPPDQYDLVRRAIMWGVVICASVFAVRIVRLVWHSL